MADESPKHGFSAMVEMKIVILDNKLFLDSKSLTSCTCEETVTPVVRKQKVSNNSLEYLSMRRPAITDAH